MFSQVCVIHSVHGGDCIPACSWTGVFVSQHAIGWRGCVSQHAVGQGVYPSMQLGRGCIPTCNWAGGVSQHAIGQGLCIPACNWAGGVHPSMQLGRGCASQHAIGQGGCQPPWTHTAPREIAIKAGGTHPIGMHSCYCL